MFKFIVMAFMFLGSVYIGFYLGENYKDRNKELRELRKAITFMNTEVLYANTPLPKAMMNASDKISGVLNIIFKETALYLEESKVDSVYDGFNLSYTSHKDKLHLKESDLMMIRDFFNSLGDTGVYGQEKVFEIADERIRKNCEEAEDEMKVNTKMYRSLGVCIGIIIVIFFW